MVNADSVDNISQVPYNFRQGRIGLIFAVGPQKSNMKLTPTMPLLSLMASSCLSVKLRAEAHSS